MLNSKEIYDKIDQLRKAKGFSLNGLSREAGISHNTLNAWKTRGTLPSLETLDCICYALRYPLTYLLSGVGEAKTTADEIEMLFRWRKCDTKQKGAILSLMDDILRLKY